MPQRLKGLPKVLEVVHFPNPVKAVQNPSNMRAEFVWKHNTTVMAGEEVEVEECGAFLWTGTEWKLRIVYSRKEFARLFDCSRGRLLPGQPYSFVNNWRTSNGLQAGTALWYFIGRRINGERVMGAAEVMTLSEIL